MLKTDTHLFFFKEYLSQWNKSTFVDSKWTTYNCCEQYMMYQKAKFFHDDKAAVRIMAADHPRDQKAEGRRVKNFVESEWIKVREQIVFDGNYLKFSQNEQYKERLLRTHPLILVEASPDDPVWGVAMDIDDPLIVDEKNWKGLNLLGIAITKVREKLLNSL